MLLGQTGEGAVAGSAPPTTLRSYDPNTGLVNEWAIAPPADGYADDIGYVPASDQAEVDAAAQNRSVEARNVHDEAMGTVLSDAPSDWNLKDGDEIAGLMRPVNQRPIRSYRTPVNVSTNPEIASVFEFLAAVDQSGMSQLKAEINQIGLGLTVLNAQEQIVKLSAELKKLGVEPELKNYATVPGDATIPLVQAADLSIQLSRVKQRLADEARYEKAYGKNWRDVRVGKSGWTVQEYEKQAFNQYQQLVDEGYAAAVRRYKEGKLDISSGYATAVGSLMDGHARRGMQLWAKDNQIHEGKMSPYLHINRRQNDYQGVNGYRIPDIRIGGASLIFDASLSPKNYFDYPQVRGFVNNSSSPNQLVVIVRPTVKGGSYVVMDYDPLAHPSYGGAAGINRRPVMWTTPDFMRPNLPNSSYQYRPSPTNIEYLPRPKGKK